MQIPDLTGIVAIPAILVLLFSVVSGIDIVY